MTTIAIRSLSCPFCQHEMTSYEIMSYHVYSSETYSDGFVENNPPMLSNSNILICSDCHKPFWRSDIKMKDPHEEGISNDKLDGLPKVMDIFDLSFAKDEDFSISMCIYYQQLLDSGFANTEEREFELRMKLWHQINNEFRYFPSSWIDALLQNELSLYIKRNKRRPRKHDKEAEIRPLFRSNLKQLLSIFKAESEEDYLLRSEIYRELGDFKRAKKQLKMIKELKNTKTYKKIKRAIVLRRTSVFKIT